MVTVMYIRICQHFVALKNIIALYIYHAIANTNRNISETSTNVNTKKQRTQ